MLFFFPDFAFSWRISGNRIGRAIRDSFFGSEVGGNAVRFCHFCWFMICLTPFVFFAVLLFLGSLFGNIFGSELLFFECRGWSCVFR